jgi:hypothetical protein
MSCDYGVWDTSLGADPKTYGKLCEGKLTPGGQSPAVDAFYRELTGRWPEIDAIPGDKIDDLEVCPWSIAMDRSGMHVIMCCVWSKADEVGEFVESLAMKNGLVFYDPQSDRVKPPTSYDLHANREKSSNLSSKFKRLFSRSPHD